MTIVRSLFMGPDLSAIFNSVAAVSIPYISSTGESTCHAAIHRNDTDTINLFRWQWQNGKNFSSQTISKIPVVVDDGVSIVSMIFAYLKPGQAHLIVGCSSGEMAVHTPRGSICVRTSFHPDTLISMNCVGDSEILDLCFLVLTYKGNIVVTISLQDLYDHIYSAHVNIDFKKTEMTGRATTADATIISSCKHPDFTEMSLSMNAESSDMLNDASSFRGDEHARHQFRHCVKSLMHPARLGCFGLVGGGKGPCLSLHWLRAATDDNIQKVFTQLRSKYEEATEEFQSAHEDEQQPLEDANSQPSSASSTRNLLEINNKSTTNLPPTHNAPSMNGGVFLTAASKAWSFMGKVLVGADSPKSGAAENQSLSNAETSAGKRKSLRSSSNQSDMQYKPPMFQPAAIVRWSARLMDATRQVTSVRVSPWDSSVGCTTDAFGRIMLVEFTSLEVSHMWKGYRDAQVEFANISLPAHSTNAAELQGSNLRRCIVIYLPKRGFLELWDLETLTRIGAAVVGEQGRLLGCKGVGSVSRPPTSSLTSPPSEGVIASPSVLQMNSASLGISSNGSDDNAVPTVSVLFVRSTGEVLLIGLWLKEEENSSPEVSPPPKNLTQQ